LYDAAKERLMSSNVENKMPAADRTTFTKLLEQLANNLAALIHNEIELMTQEVREKAGVVRSGVLIVALGAVFSFAGFMSLCAAVIIGLTRYMAPVTAAFVTGAALAVSGVVLALLGYRHLQKSILLNKEENADAEQEVT
jgi:VIT1/CCC1 family predicted Fe2+/Mn2+ transporter